MSGGISKVYQATTRKQHNAVTVTESEFIYLWFDVGFFNSRQILQFFDLYFIVEVTDIADNSHIFHLPHVFHSYDVAVTCGSNENIGLSYCVLHGSYLVPFHGCLEGADRINLGDQHPGSEAAHALRATFAYISETTNQHGFSGHHHVGGTFNSISETFSASVKIVKFRFGNGVVYINCGEK